MDQRTKRLKQRVRNLETAEDVIIYLLQYTRGKEHARDMRNVRYRIAREIEDTMRANPKIFPNGIDYRAAVNDEHAAAYGAAMERWSR